MMKHLQQFAATALGVGTLWMFSVSAAFAQGNGNGNGHGHHGQGHGRGHGHHGHGASGGAPGAPEIDVSQGLAALAIMLCVFLLLREHYLRQHAKA